MTTQDLYLIALRSASFIDFEDNIIHKIYDIPQSESVEHLRSQIQNVIFLPKGVTLTLTDVEETATCSDCGSVIQAVRLGKWQCDKCV